MVRGKEQIFFTAFIGLVIIGALFVAKDWPVRASIIILLLGGIGVILTGIQLAMDFKALRTEGSQITRRRSKFKPSSTRDAGEVWRFGRGSGDSFSRFI